MSCKFKALISFPSRGLATVPGEFGQDQLLLDYHNDKLVPICYVGHFVGSILWSDKVAVIVVFLAIVLVAVVVMVVMVQVIVVVAVVVTVVIVVLVVIVAVIIAAAVIEIEKHLVVVLKL